MKCPNCSESDHELGAVYCHVCGTRLNPTDVNVSIPAGRQYFEWAENFSEGLAMVAIDGKTGYINKSGQLVISLQFNIFGRYTFGSDSVVGFKDGLSPFCTGEFPSKKYGCIDRQGNMQIPAQFDCIWQFSEGLAPFKINRNCKWGFINDKGQIVIPALYEMVGQFNEGLAVVKLERDRFAFIDQIGQIAIEKTKNVVFNLSDGFPIRKGTLQGCGSFHEGLATVECSGKKGYIDKTGVFFSTKFDKTNDFSEGLAAFAMKVNHHSRWGYIDKKLETAIEPRFQRAENFHEGRAVVRDGEKFGFVDKTGHIVVACVYDKAAPFYEGLAAVEINRKIGYIDTAGNVIIPPRFDLARSFSEGLAAVCEKGKWGFIDKSGDYAF